MCVSSNYLVKNANLFLFQYVIETVLKKTYYGQVIGNVYERQNQTSFNTRDGFNDKLLGPYFL